MLSNEQIDRGLKKCLEIGKNAQTAGESAHALCCYIIHNVLETMKEPIPKCKRCGKENPGFNANALCLSCVNELDAFLEKAKDHLTRHKDDWCVYCKKGDK